MSNLENIQTEIIFRATAELQVQIEKELLAETPELERAMAIIHENSSRNEPRDSTDSNPEDKQTTVA